MRTNTIQLLINSSIMLSWIFIPTLAKDLGASNLQVGLVGASYGVSIFISSYIFGRASDMWGRKIFMTLGLGLCAVSFLLQILARDVLSLAALRFIAGFTVGISTAPLIAYVFETGGKMGKFSSYGSLGWAVGNVLAGIIAVYWQLFTISSLFFLIAFAISLRLPPSKHQKVRIPLFPKEMIKRNFRVYFSYFLRNTGASSIWTIFPLFLLDIGASKFWIGMIYFMNSGLQVILMRYVDRYRDTQLINAGLLISAFVFLGYSFTNDYRQVIPLQVFLAFSWSCLYVGSLLYMTHRNVERATSVGMLTSVISISGAFGPILGGVISQLLGYREVMVFAAFLSLVGFLISALGKRNP
jgi:MFS family permease